MIIHYQVRMYHSQSLSADRNLGRQSLVALSNLGYCNKEPLTEICMSDRYTTRTTRPLARPTARTI